MDTVILSAEIFVFETTFEFYGQQIVWTYEFCFTFHVKWVYILQQ